MVLATLPDKEVIRCQPQHMNFNDGDMCGALLNMKLGLEMKRNSTMGYFHYSFLGLAYARGTAANLSKCKVFKDVGSFQPGIGQILKKRIGGKKKVLFIPFLEKLTEAEDGLSEAGIVILKFDQGVISSRGTYICRRGSPVLPVQLAASLRVLSAALKNVYKVQMTLPTDFELIPHFTPLPESQNPIWDSFENPRIPFGILL
jgi:hypothetical protein